MNKLSHSSISVYQECSYKWKLHYLDKIRSKTMGSALFFGTAIDKALELALKEFPNSDINNIKAKFVEHWSTGELNNEVIDIKTSELVKYSKNDVDEALAYIPWVSLLIKGNLIIDEFFEKILPNIEKVLAAQEEIFLENTNGDKVTGFVDAVLKWKGYDKPIIFDFKTTSRDYKEDSVVTSPQLNLYKHALSEKYATNLAGFIVFNKQIKKNISKTCSICGFDGSGKRHDSCNNITGKTRCNGAWITTLESMNATSQVLIAKIDETFENKVLDGFDNVNIQMQSNEYTRNYKSCYSKYGKCTYFSLCKHNSMEGLIKK